MNQRNQFKRSVFLKSRFCQKLLIKAEILSALKNGGIGKKGAGSPNDVITGLITDATNRRLLPLLYRTVRAEETSPPGDRTSSQTGKIIVLLTGRMGLVLIGRTGPVQTGGSGCGWETNRVQTGAF